MCILRLSFPKVPFSNTRKQGHIAITIHIHALFSGQHCLEDLLWFGVSWLPWPFGIFWSLAAFPYLAVIIEVGTFSTWGPQMKIRMFMFLSKLLHCIRSFQSTQRAARLYLCVRRSDSPLLRPTFPPRWCYCRPDNAADWDRSKWVPHLTWPRRRARWNYLIPHIWENVRSLWKEDTGTNFCLLNLNVSIYWVLALEYT